MSKLQNFFERNAFGVCTKIADKLNLPISSVRLFFIYASFLTFGSPLIAYLGLAFLMNFRKHMRKRNSSVLYY